MLWPYAAKEEMYGVLLPVKHLFYPSTSYGPVSVCVYLSQVGVLLKQLNELSWF